jgi:hypothetical protein
VNKLQIFGNTHLRKEGTRRKVKKKRVAEAERTCGVVAAGDKELAEAGGSQTQAVCLLDLDCNRTAGKAPSAACNDLQLSVPRLVLNILSSIDR